MSKSSINWIPPIQNYLTPSVTEKRRNIVKYMTWNSIRFESVKTSMPKPVKSLGCIKCHSLSSSRPNKSLPNSIRYSCQKICSLWRRPESILSIWNKFTFLKVISKSIIHEFFKDFTNHWIKTNMVVVLAEDLSLTFLSTGRWDLPQMRPSNNLEDYSWCILKRSAGIHESWGSNFFRNITGIQSVPDALMNQGCLWPS